MKNQFNSYLYDQWYGFYQKAGDQDKLTELTTAKKENEAKFKQSIDLLNTKLGEESKQIEVKKGGKYTYHSKTKNADVTVTVLSAGLGTDENGKVDNTKPEYKGMYKVKSDKDVFWVSPSALKSKTVEKAIQGVKKEDIKVGDKFSYTPDPKGGVEQQPVFVTVNKGDDGNPIFSTTANGTKTHVSVTAGNENKTKYTPNIARLKPTK